MEIKIKEKNQLFKKIIFQKYKLIKLLSNESNNFVFEGQNIIDKTKVAIKLENKVTGNNTLTNECYLLLDLKGYGIPEILSFGHSGKYNVLIEELLGKSLQELYELNDNEIPLKDICMISIQIIERLQYIHSKYIIHRNINPNNFLIGKKNSSLIYIIDFAYAKKYRSKYTGNHIKFSLNQKMVGEISYISANSMRGGEQSRKDDLESFGYMIIYLLKGFLPWKEFENKKNKIKKIYELKNKISFNRLCRYLPEEIKIFMEYTKKLSFEQEPNYEYLKGLFKEILIKMEKIHDNIFFWNKNKEDETKKNDLLKKKTSPYKKIFRKNNNSINNINEIKQKFNPQISERNNSKEKNETENNYFEILSYDRNSQRGNEIYNSNLNNLSSNDVNQSKSYINQKNFIYTKKNNINCIYNSCNLLNSKSGLSNNKDNLFKKYNKNKIKKKNNKSELNLKLLTINNISNSLINLKKNSPKELNYFSKNRISAENNNHKVKSYKNLTHNFKLLSKDNNIIDINNKNNEFYPHNPTKKDCNNSSPKNSINLNNNSNEKNYTNYKKQNYLDKLNIIGYLKNLKNLNNYSNKKVKFNKILKNKKNNFDYNLKTPRINIDKINLNKNFNLKPESYSNIIFKNENSSQLISPNYIYNINQIQYTPNIKKIKKHFLQKFKNKNLKNMNNIPSLSNKHFSTSPIINTEINKRPTNSNIMELQIDFSKNKNSEKKSTELEPNIKNNLNNLYINTKKKNHNSDLNQKTMKYYENLYQKNINVFE